MRCKLIIPSSGIVELYDETDISLTYQVADIKDPQKRHADYSKTITVPGSHNNNRMFQYIFSIGIDRYFDPNKKAPCRLMIDSEVVMKGFMRLRNIVKTDMKVDYEIEITGRTADLFIAMGDTYIKDLSWTDLNHTFNQANQIASWSNTIGSNYVYPFIDYGVCQDDLTYGVNDFYPALYVKEIWDRIFMNAGFQYSSTSNFFTSSPFKNLILPYTSSDLTLSATDQANNSFSVYKSTQSTYTVSSNAWQSATIIFNTETSDPGNIYNTSNGFFTVARSGWYTIDSLLEVEKDIAAPATSGTNVVYVRADIYNATSNLILSSSNTPILYDYPAKHPLTNHAYVHLNVGDIIRIIFYRTFITGSPNNDIHITAGMNFSTTVDPVLQAGDTMIMSQTIDPKLKCKDFVNSIIKMFNLYVEYDKDTPNKLIIDPRNSFYNTTVQDWTQKRDLSRELEITPMGALQARRYIWQYKEDKDWLNELYKQETGLTYGEKRLDIDNDFLTNEQKEEIVFSASPLDSSSAIAQSVNPTSYDDRYFVRLYGNGQGAKSKITANTRILYYGGLRQCKPWYYTTGYSVPNLPSSGVTQYPYAGHLDNPINPTIDLSWWMPLKVYYDPTPTSTYTNNNLYNTYWSQEMDEITDKNSSIVTGYFKLTPYDISILDFRNIYRFDFQEFRLNKVYDYNPLKDGFTKCEFIKMKHGAAFIGSNSTTIGGIGVGVPTSWYSTQRAGKTTRDFNNVSAGWSNNIGPSASSVLVTGNNNVVGDGANSITILSSSGCVVAGGLDNVYIVNSSGVTVTESNTIVVNNIVTSGGSSWGTYTPTITLILGTEGGSPTTYPCQWMRVGNVVTVSGMSNLSPSGTDTAYTITLPVSSVFTQTYQAGGTSRSGYVGGANKDDVGSISAIAATSTVRLRFYNYNGGQDYYFHFTYLVL